MKKVCCLFVAFILLLSASIGFAEENYIISIDDSYTDRIRMSDYAYGREYTISQYAPYTPTSTENSWDQVIICPYLLIPTNCNNKADVELGITVWIFAREEFDIAKCGIDIGKDYQITFSSTPKWKTLSKGSL